MTDVGGMIQEVLETIAPLLRSAQVAVEYVAPEAPLHLFLQAPLLRQALLDLISTAIHCVPCGQVRIQAQALAQRVCIRIQAIAHSDAAPPQLWKCAEHVKMAEQLVRLAQGTLEIAAGVGDKTNGESVSSVAGREPLTARVTLPAAGGSAAADPVAVLVIEDNADALQLFQRYLSGSRYRFVGAQDAQQGLKLAAELIPQIIVLDVMMPGKDGWALLGQLREHPKTCTIPVVVCTILPHQELALALGAAEFIRKPVTRATLLSALDRQLGRLPRTHG
jgi:CheY-like chemotaxis protein